MMAIDLQSSNFVFDVEIIFHFDRILFFFFVKNFCIFSSGAKFWKLKITVTRVRRSARGISHREMAGCCNGIGNG